MQRAVIEAESWLCRRLRSVWSGLIPTAFCVASVLISRCLLRAAPTATGSLVSLLKLEWSNRAKKVLLIPFSLFQPAPLRHREIHTQCRTHPRRTYVLWLGDRWRIKDLNNAKRMLHLHVWANLTSIKQCLIQISRSELTFWDNSLLNEITVLASLTDVLFAAHRTCRFKRLKTDPRFRTTLCNMFNKLPKWPGNITAPLTWSEIRWCMNMHEYANQLQENISVWSFGKFDPSCVNLGPTQSLKRRSHTFKKGKKKIGLFGASSSDQSEFRIVTENAKEMSVPVLWNNVS